MYKFKLESGREAIVRFKHKRGAEGKAPKSTICKIFVDDELLFTGWSKPATELASIHGPILDKKPLRVIKSFNGNARIFIYRGDQFSKKRGRTEAFYKAISSMSERNRLNAVSALFEQGVIDDYRMKTDNA